ncbi:MAG: hypothetical protein M3493_01270 [Actinomycetota bacterium]|jgi:predicted transcriptional regulator|nr:hypothetical protein [Actinomycetota bacterium]
MPVKKMSVALDSEVAAAAASAAEAHGRSLSSWLTDAARSQLRIEQGLAAVRAWEEEQGALTAEETASADAILDDLLARPSRRSA